MKSRKEFSHKYYLENTEKIKNRSSDYYAIHKLEILNKRKQEYLKSKNKKLQYQKNYAEKNKDKYLAYQKEYRQSHKKESSEYFKARRNTNRKEITLYHKEWKRKQYQNNIQFRLKSCISSRIRMAIKNDIKYFKTINLIGCTVEQLKQHLESQFKIGMSWNNYGKWHIDHIRSCSSFNLTKESEQKKCFNYTNLQPLWAEENIKKSNKVI